MSTESYRVMLATLEPRKEILIPISEFMSMARDETDATPPPDPRAPYAHPASALEEMSARILAIERRIMELSQEPSRRQPDPDDDDIPAFLRGREPAASTVDTVDLGDIRSRLDAIERSHDQAASGVCHDVANLQQAMQAVEDTLRSSTAPAAAPQPPCHEARSAIGAAGRSRRARSALLDDLALTIKLAEVAHLANTGQEGPIALMSVLGEAMQSTWQEAARALIARSDALANVAVRSYAVEIATINAIASADDDMAMRIRDGAVSAIGSIEG